MSHFAVFVIGPNVDEQLAPYHEFESTGDDNQYVREIDVTAECKEKGLDYYGFEDNTVIDVAQLDLADKHKYGYALVDGNGALVRAVNRTNPNAQWDWYQIGGRFSDWLKLKSGATGFKGARSWTNAAEPTDPTRADAALKCDIDFEAMRDEAGNEAATNWDKARALLSAAVAPTQWDSWEHLRDVVHKGDIETARKAYHAQPSVKVLADFAGFFDTCDEYMQSREEFVQRARDRACAPYALVNKGEWTGRGKMGWFGVSDDKVAPDDWCRLVNQLLDNLPDDTLITVVDCHI